MGGCFLKETAHHGASSYPRYGPQFQCEAVTCYPGAFAPVHGKPSGSERPQAAAGPGLANSGANPPWCLIGWQHGRPSPPDRIWDEALVLQCKAGANTHVSLAFWRTEQYLCCLGSRPFGAPLKEFSCCSLFDTGAVGWTLALWHPNFEAVNCKYQFDMC